MPMLLPDSDDPGPGPAPPAEVPPDEAIVGRVLGGDTDSFELIMRRYNQRLFRVVRSIVGDAAEAEDILQETYLRAYQHLGRFEGRSSFSTWLTRIAVYEATARRRKRRRLRIAPTGEAGGGALAASAGPRDASDEASLGELRSVLAGAVDSLPTDLRLVFTLRMVERLSTDETAECLSLTPANVKVRLHRSRAHLQSWIDRRIGEEARRLYVFAGESCDRVVRRVLERIGRDGSS